MLTTHPVAQKCITKVRTKPDSKMFFCLFFFFRWASSKLRDTITIVFTQNRNILHWAVHQPIAFDKFEVTWGGSNWSLNNYGFIYNAIFFICMHAHKPLSNEMSLLRLLNYHCVPPISPLWIHTLPSLQPPSSYIGRFVSFKHPIGSASSGTSQVHVHRINVALGSLWIVSKTILK